MRAPRRVLSRQFNVEYGPAQVERIVIERLDRPLDREHRELVDWWSLGVGADHLGDDVGGRPDVR